MLLYSNLISAYQIYIYFNDKFVHFQATFVTISCCVLSLFKNRDPKLNLANELSDRVKLYFHQYFQKNTSAPLDYLIILKYCHEVPLKTL